MNCSGGKLQGWQTSGDDDNGGGVELQRRQTAVGADCSDVRSRQTNFFEHRCCLITFQIPVGSASKPRISKFS